MGRYHNQITFNVNLDDVEIGLDFDEIAEALEYADLDSDERRRLSEIANTGALEDADLEELLDELANRDLDINELTTIIKSNCGSLESQLELFAAVIGGAQEKEISTLKYQKTQLEQEVEELRNRIEELENPRTVEDKDDQY